MTIGLEDYTADLGVVKTAEGRESQYARSRVVNAAQAAGVQAIDSVSAMSATWKGCDVGEKLAGSRVRRHGMHPSRADSRDPRGVSTERSRDRKSAKVVAAFEEAQSKGLAVVSLGSKMIDPPVVQRALKLVERARRWERSREANVKERVELAHNAAGRAVPTMVNGKPQIRFWA